MKRSSSCHSNNVLKPNKIQPGSYLKFSNTFVKEPKNEIPKQAIKVINSMDLGVSCFSLVMVLDKDYQELGIKDYATFYAPLGLDTNRSFEGGRRLEKWDFITSVCANTVIEDATPKGTSFYSITFLPLGESFKDLSLEDYQAYKKKNIDHFLEMESQRLGVDLKNHILEMVVETPISISHYTSAFMGSIYGYRHAMNNHAVAREQMEKEEQFINGLFFVGAHQIIGDGMSPAISSGIKGANDIILEDKKRKGDND